ncbi:MAG TPA: glycerophosphodiester phosphodiesterase [Bryobacteraceae bacterium]|nr:glycerophosphodiester phosphodiesterase [Bryobacteraceae bacterium]
MKSALRFVLMGGVLKAAPRILVHGHRGARAARPENTLPAFEYAIAAGADFLELDVAVTRDDVLVVSHDPVFNPDICRAPGGSRVIRELTLAELRLWDCGSLHNPRFPSQQPVPGARIPTLDEVLDLAGSGAFGFNIETKSFPEHPELTPPPERFAALLLAAIRRRRLESRVVVQSFDFRTLAALRALAPEIRRAALDERGRCDFVSLAREAAEAQIVAPAFALVTPEKVRAAHAAGIEVVPWTANAAPAWDCLINAGVDGIITDDPAGLLAYLRERNLR